MDDNPVRARIERAPESFARDAEVRRIEPFHFSPRYNEEEARMLEDVSEAFEKERRQCRTA